VPVSAARAMFENAPPACVPAPKPSGAKVSRFGGAPKCPACSKSAYANESVNAIGKTWHKTCFACATCGKGMGGDAANACDNEGTPYCKACYGKNFGPKGIGFGNTMGDTGVAR
jgi:cysteine/glycine-rich protein